MSLCTAIFVFCGALCATLPAEQDPPPVGCGHAKAAARQFISQQQAPPNMAGLSGEDTDVQHYFLNIELDPNAEWIGGSNTMTVRSVAGSLNVFRFRLDDIFDITDLQVDGMPATWLRIDAATVEVTLDPPYASDEIFEVYVAYDGNPDGGGFGSIVFRTRSGADEIWTLSEPWFAHTWWPAKDDSTDKTTADLWFTVPDDMVVASNGLLQGVDPQVGNKSRYRWRTDYPTADYLYCIGATNYNSFSETWNYDGGSMPLEFYIYPEEDNPDNRDAWRENLDMLDVFSAHYGLYPFVDEKYGMCQVGFGGGMEHQTMTSQGGFWEYITAHELAHQWWGDMVTCGTWHDIWLNEGFATYSEALWFGDKPGSNGFADYQDWMDVRRPSAVDDSVYVYDATSVNRIFSGNFTYRKGAWVVHMLRHVVGDDTFLEILEAYRAAHEYSTAITDDLRDVAESVYGADLGWFFSEWIYDIGAPAYAYAWQNVSVGGQQFVELYIQQVQSPSYPVFTMPIDIVTTTGGNDTVNVVWNDAEAEHLLFTVEAAPSSLAFDPDVWILEIGKQQTAFVEGPPKIVSTSPAPGATLLADEVSQIGIVFHKDVLTGAQDYTLVGDTVGSVAFNFSYDAGAQTVSLSLPALLDPDAYTLTVSDQVVDDIAGLALDGEVSDPLDPLALPSGDGLAGGSAQLRFSILAACSADTNGDGVVDAADLSLLLGAWGTADPATDFNGDGVVDAVDLGQLLGAWGSCP